MRRIAKGQLLFPDLDNSQGLGALSPVLLPSPCGSALDIAKTNQSLSGVFWNQNALLHEMVLRNVLCSLVEAIYGAGIVHCPPGARPSRQMSAIATPNSDLAKNDSLVASLSVPLYVILCTKG